MIEAFVVAIISLIGVFLYGGKKKESELAKKAEVQNEKNKIVVAEIKTSVENSDLDNLVASNNSKFNDTK